MPRPGERGKSSRRPALPVPSKSQADTRRILAKLYTQHPNADTELHFSNPYELLVATILSAQCTDERVNQVTPALFKRYPNARALAAATTSELEPQIQSTGFFRAKSKSLVGMATAVVEQHAGEIPNTMDALVTLPGVGRKTANVVLGHALGVPGLPVDRHVLRVSNRIGIARSEDPEVVEQQLCAAMPPPEWTKTSDTLILHGRRICKPKPLCDRCVVRDDCEYYRLVVSRAAESGGRATAPKRPKTGKSVEGRRAPKVQGTGRGGGAPTERSETGMSVEGRRAAKWRGTGAGGGAPTERAETGKSVEVRRGAKRRGTGAGGAAFAKAPASRAEAKRRRGAPAQTKK
jgi:endonuclease-3